MPENLGLGVGIGSVATSTHQTPPSPTLATINMENGGHVETESGDAVLME